MTHPRESLDYDGAFTVWRRATGTLCRNPNCGSPDVLYRVWDSQDGASHDYQYRCAVCDRVWWNAGVEG
jgi:hypothetical protein